MKVSSKSIYYRRLQKLWEQTKNNNTHVRQLHKIRKKLEPVQFIKHKHKIEVLKDYLIEHSYTEYNFSKTFIKMAEWGINHCKVVCDFYTNDGYHIGGLFEDFTYNFSYAWKQLDKTANLYSLRIILSNVRNYNPNPENPNAVIITPVYCNINVIFHNKRIYHEIQHKKI